MFESHHYLDGNLNKHNKGPLIRGNIMNSGSSSTMSEKLGILSAWYWKDINANYLQFILPTETANNATNQ